MSTENHTPQFDEDFERLEEEKIQAREALLEAAQRDDSTAFAKLIDRGERVQKQIDSLLAKRNHPKHNHKKAA